MRKLLFTVLILSTNSLLAQKVEWSFHTQSGFFKFRGPDAEDQSVIFMSDVSNIPDRTADRYGKGSGFSFVAGVTSKKLSKRKWISGVSLAFESLTSKLAITKLSYRAGMVDATGSARVTHQFITINPFIGKRIFFKKISLDIATGVEAAACLKSHEKASAVTATDYKVQTDLDTNNPKIDARLSLLTTTWYNNIGLMIGYSHGLINYYGRLMGGDPEAYASFLRLGVSLRL